MSMDRSMVGRMGAHAKWAATPDRSAATAAARKASLDRFERQVDPDGCLDPAERARRAEHARKAYFTGLALKSSRARAVNAAIAKEKRQRDRDEALALVVATTDDGSHRPACVYRFFDAEGRLLYVGKTVRGARRFWEHAETALWWTDVAYSTVEHFASDAQALAAEELAIRNEAPQHNVRLRGH